MGQVCDLERGRTVGLGTYGKVLLVRHAATGTPFALKCLDRRLVVANAQQRAVRAAVAAAAAAAVRSGAAAGERAAAAA